MIKKDFYIVIILLIQCEFLTLENGCQINLILILIKKGI